MEYILSESLKRKKSSIARLIAFSIISIIILNVCITLTNNIIITYRNYVCFGLLLAYCLIIFFAVKQIFFTYIYNISEDFICFEKQSFKHTKGIRKICFKDIRYIDKYENIVVNSNIQSTYFYIYGHTDNECFFCEYETNEKLYRFVFKPSERLIRILERKIGNKNYEHGKDGNN